METCCDAESFQIGMRIFNEGDIGTVCFIGELKSQEGLWLGIEWDNPGRGKHNGTYLGISYFRTRSSTGGSFIRPWKAETGMSCPEAIRQKYGVGEEHIKDRLSANLALPQKSGKMRLVETVGFKKVAGQQSNFLKLTHAVVSAMLVNGLGEPGEMKQLVPNVVTLDLSENLIKSWVDVAAITEQLKKLKSLILNLNRLQIESDMKKLKAAFEGLEELALNRMNYNWADILACSLAWPDVQNLYVCNNGLSILDTPVHPALGNVKVLSLEDNDIESWLEIKKLGQLTHLEELYLDNNRLEFIIFEETQPYEKTDLFPNLTALSLKNNRLSTWRDVCELNKLQNLHHLKLFQNPIMDSVSPETARQLVIAKIANLHVLNKSEINRSERKGAEIDYIKRYHRTFVQGAGVGEDLDKFVLEPEFQIEHPTYISLLRKHGRAEDSEVNAPSSLLKNNLISVQLFNTHAPYGPKIVKRLPVTMLLCKVKALLRRLFKIPVNTEIKMICVRAGCARVGGAEMENDLREIGYYCGSDGDCIEISWK